jgi:ABC-2 type transport system permease protein
MSAEERPTVRPVGPARLGWLFLRVGVLNDLQYRVNFFIQLFQSLLSIGTGLVVLALVFSHTDELGGWSRSELLAVMGIFTIMGGVIRSVIQPNMQRLLDDVRQGNLDFILTKPADSQVLISVRDVRIWPAVDVVTGGVVLGVALYQLQERMGFSGAIAFVLLICLGAVMIYCVWLAITTGAFWLVRMDEVQELFDGIYRAGMYPVGIYPSWLRFGLTFLVPIAFAITVPAEAVTSRLGWGSVTLALVVTVALVIGTRRFWKLGLRHYSGASS